MERHGNGTIMTGGSAAYRVAHQTDACVVLEERSVCVCVTLYSMCVVGSSFCAMLGLPSFSGLPLFLQLY